MTGETISETAQAYKQQLERGNIQLGPLDIHRYVFPISATTVALFVCFALFFPSQAADVFLGTRSWITVQFDWLFIVAANVILLLCLGLILSPLGAIRIGGANARASYSYASWLAMMFAAGVGIGLMFYGVLEPVNHTLKPPLNMDSSDTAIAARAGVAAAIYHWGFHPWAIYSIVGLALAVFHFNKGLPLTLRSAFYPLLKEKIWGWPGNVIDILAVFATLFGLATSLGLGAQQIAAGLSHLFSIANTTTTQLLVIVCITAVALASVIRGLDKGVKVLSEINIAMAVALMVFVILAGPTLKLLFGSLTALGDYVSYLPALSNPIDREDQYFYHDWTIFYWAWWIAWSPFVGMFIARVSRGRTVREFLCASLLLPTLACGLWMASFGGLAIHQSVVDGFNSVFVSVQQSQVELALFHFLTALPLAKFTSIAALVLILVFFVTSMDSGSLVIDTITAGGKIDAPVSQRVFWCTFEGLVAMALLLGGGLSALQAASLATGLPFAIVVLLMSGSLIAGLREELRLNRKGK